jgi:hypothetical protein
MRNVFHKLLLVVVFLIGSAVTIYLYYFCAICKARSFNEAVFYFVSSLGVLIGTNVLIQAIEWSRTRQYASAMVGHLAHISDIEYLDRGGKAWKEHYSLLSVSFQRPTHGYEKKYVLCSHGCPIQIEVWSHRAAIRNKIFLVLLYGLYGFWWLFLVHHRLPIESPTWFFCLYVVIAIPLIPVVPFAFIGFYYLFSPWMGTADGIGAHFSFFGSRNINATHKVFANEPKDFFAPWRTTLHSN